MLNKEEYVAKILYILDEYNFMRGWDLTYLIASLPIRPASRLPDSSTESGGTRSNTWLSVSGLRI